MHWIMNSPTPMQNSLLYCTVSCRCLNVSSTGTGEYLMENQRDGMFFPYLISSVQDNPSPKVIVLLPWYWPYVLISIGQQNKYVTFRWIWLVYFTSVFSKANMVCWLGNIRPRFWVTSAVWNYEPSLLISSTAFWRQALVIHTQVRIVNYFTVCETWPGFPS